MICDGGDSFFLSIFGRFSLQNEVTTYFKIFYLSSFLFYSRERKEGNSKKTESEPDKTNTFFLWNFSFLIYILFSVSNQIPQNIEKDLFLSPPFPFFPFSFWTFSQFVSYFLFFLPVFNLFSFFYFSFFSHLFSLYIVLFIKSNPTKYFKRFSSFTLFWKFKKWKINYFNFNIISRWDSKRSSWKCNWVTWCR